MALDAMLHVVCWAEGTLCDPLLEQQSGEAAKETSTTFSQIFKPFEVSLLRLSAFQFERE